MRAYKIVPMLPPYDKLDDDAFLAAVRRQLPERMLRYGQAVREVEAVELVRDPGVLPAHHGEHHPAAPCASGGCHCDDDVGMLAQVLALGQLPAVAIATVDAVRIGRDS